MATFLDTGFYFAFLSMKDKYHQRAVNIFKEIVERKHGKIFTSDIILNESLTLLNYRTKGSRQDLIKKMKILFFGEKSIADELISIPIDWLEEITELLIKLTNNKRIFSFTDCSNIIICEKKKISFMVSFDQDYAEFLNVIS